MEWSSKIAKDLHIWCVGLCETVDQLAMANSICWYGHVLRRDDGHVLRRALDFEVEGQMKIGRPKWTCKKQVEEESVKIDLRREDMLLLSSQRTNLVK